MHEHYWPDCIVQPVTKQKKLLFIVQSIGFEDYLFYLPL